MQFLIFKYISIIFLKVQTGQVLGTVRHQGSLSTRDFISYLFRAIDNNLKTKDDRLIRLFQNAEKHLRSPLGTENRGKWGRCNKPF